MKKQILGLALAAFASAAASAQVQSRLALYEEFSGENCGPCAAANPGLWSLLSASGNDAKVMLIKYQSPIPSAGPIYNLYKTVTNTRMTYYNVPFAPYGRLDGKVLGTGSSSPGHVSYLTQSDIDNDAAAIAPFNLTVTHSYNAGADSITANVSITANAAFNTLGANMKLRIALIEHLSYCTAPGTNGETEFHNVVREMYPDAAGTQLLNSWTANQNQNYTIKGKVPTWVDKSNDNVILVAWIQNDADLSVAQAAKSSYVPLTRDVALTGCGSSKLLCMNSGSSTINATIPATLTNTGSSTLTAATIYYKLDNGSLSQQSWNGSLAPGASTTVNISLTAGAGSHIVYDSVAAPNGAADLNPVNNAKSSSLTVRDVTAVALPINGDFETALPTTWSLYDEDGNGDNWIRRTMTAHGSSLAALMHDNYDFVPGETNYAILPQPNLPSGAKALDFWVSYAQYSTEDDKLEVVYSTDCGTSWNAIWTSSGSALATHSPVSASYAPTSDADWKSVSVDLSSVPNGAMIALRATSDFGNNLYVDDIKLRTGAPSGVSHIVSGGTINLYPNPATNATTLELMLINESQLSVAVVDALGRTVTVAADGKLGAGKQRINISTSNLSAGIYNVVVRTSEGSITRRLSVVK